MKIENSYQEKNPKKKKVLVILLLFLFFCMAGFGIYALITFDSNINANRSADISSTDESKQLDENGNAVSGAVQSKSPEEILEGLKKAQINVTDKLSSHILFPSGKAGTQGSNAVNLRKR